MNATDPPTLARLPSGIPGLDRVLKGGLLAGGVYLFVGAPGTGKTILANQASFHHTRGGGRVVYVTMLNETHTRLLAHMQTMSFYDPTAVGKALRYFSGYSALVQEGTEGLLRFLRKIITNHQASLLVLEGLSTVALLAESEIGLNVFLQGLQTINEMQGCTSLLLSHRSHFELHVEHMIADGLLEMRQELVGMQLVRELGVQKMRGSDFLEGLHHFTINAAGISLYPRLESTVSLADATPLPHDLPAKRFGIAGVDAMLGEGLPAYSTTILYGVPGSGKTSLGLHFLGQGALQGEPSLYFGFNEPPARLLHKAAFLGLDLQQAVQEGGLILHRELPVEQIADALAARLLALVDQHGIKRLFLDGIKGLQAAMHPESRLPGFLSALTHHLRQREVTMLFALEMQRVIGPEILMPEIGISEHTDNLLCLRYVELDAQLLRTISILKMHDTIGSGVIHTLSLSDQGIEVASGFGGAEAILTGTAHTPPPSPDSAKGQSDE